MARVILLPDPNRPPVETLEALLGCFNSPKEAGCAAGRESQAGYNWYGRDGRAPLSLPSDDAVVRLADHAGLSDQELGRVYRDIVRRRQERRQARRLQYEFT